MPKIINHTESKKIAPIIRGALKSFNIGATSRKYKSIISEFVANEYSNLNSGNDWISVGNDLTIASDKFKKEFCPHGEK